MEIIVKFIRELHGLVTHVTYWRNPTISYGGLIFMYCVGISDQFTMNLPLQILKPLAADRKVHLYSDVEVNPL